MARAGSGRKGRGKTSSGSSTNQNVMPDVYREMLADAVSSSPTKFNEEEKPIKRRRVAGRMVESSDDGTTHYQSDQASTDAVDTDIERPTPNSQVARQQTAYAESDDSADSDVDWEEVDLKDALKEDLSEEDTVQDQELNLVLGGESRETRRPPTTRRKPVSAAGKKLRLEIHKMHLLSLLVHVHRRDHWCNDEKVHKVLRKLLDKRAISYLNPDCQKSQFQRSRSFVDGLEQAVNIWKERFRIAARGMSRSYWADDPESLANASLPEDLDLPIQKSDFLEVADILEASRDVGAQLFCALLRSVGVDARLVCSLQPLPFTAAARSTTPQKSMPMRIVADPESRNITSGDESGADALSDASLSVPRIVGSVGGRNRFASANSSSASGLSKPKPKPKRIRESPYPIYWVEALDEAHQKWIAVDPLVTKSVSKPARLEPPASDPENRLSYVVAFEDDGSARDVTRRYSKAYNAKTRKERVEVTKGGEKWWRRVMMMYRRDHPLDRDQIEDAQLAQREAQEGMPKNVQDFKDHPYYALERHMRRSEVIHPKREVGKVAASKSGGNKPLEPIYRRRDVYEVKSADKWYRMGREIKTGEQPLKRVTARRSQKSVFDDDQMSEEEDTAGTGLYAVFQTTTYNAPPVVNGRIPKNVYGNLDIFVPSMVPAGGVHITHPETTRAAKMLSIDYADAVTGFAFKGRHGTAIVNGAVVATQYREAVEEVINAFEYERTEAEEARRSAEALRMWRRLLTGLRIRERIEGYEVEGERDAPRERMEEMDEEEVDDEEAGGFLPNRDAEGVVEPTAGRMFVRGLASPDEDGDGFMADEEDLGGGFINDDDDQDGGLIAGNEDSGGGFMPDDEVENPNHDVNAEDQPTTVYHAHDRENENFGGFDTSGIDEDAQDAQDAMREAEPADPHESYDLEIPISGEGGNSIPNDNQGGGFSPNDINETTPPTTPQPPQLPQPPVRQLPSEANEPPPRAPTPLGLAHEDLAEGRMLQTLYESSQMTLRKADTSPGYPAVQHDTSEDISLPPAQAQAQTDAAEPESQSPASDLGSLLSHDPEDEDAEPEWLA